MLLPFPLACRSWPLAESVSESRAPTLRYLAGSSSIMKAPTTRGNRTQGSVSQMAGRMALQDERSARMPVQRPANPPNDDTLRSV